MSTKSTPVVSSLAFISSLALAQTEIPATRTQTLIRDVEVTTTTVPVPVFTNEVTISGVGFRHTTIDRTDELIGKKTSDERSITHLGRVEPSIMARSSFGPWVVRPGLSILSEGPVGTLGLGYDSGFVEVGALVSSNLGNGSTGDREGILAPQVGKFDASDNTFSGYVVAKSAFADPLSLEFEGQLGWRRIYEDVSFRPTTDMSGLTGRAIARAFVDVAPQLGLGFSAGLHFTNLSGKMALNTPTGIQRGDSKATRITWNFQLANVRYRF